MKTKTATDYLNEIQDVLSAMSDEEIEQLYTSCEPAEDDYSALEQFILESKYILDPDSELNKNQSLSLATTNNLAIAA